MTAPLIELLCDGADVEGILPSDLSEGLASDIDLVRTHLTGCLFLFFLLFSCFLRILQKVECKCPNGPRRNQKQQTDLVGGRRRPEVPVAAPGAERPGSAEVADARADDRAQRPQREADPPLKFCKRKSADPETFSPLRKQVLMRDGWEAEAPLSAYRRGRQKDPAYRHRDKTRSGSSSKEAAKTR
jgi:hypothetical protein